MIDLQGNYNNTRARMSPFATKGKKGTLDVYYPAIKCTVNHVQHVIRIVLVPFFQREEATRMASALIRNESVQGFVYEQTQERVDAK